MLKNENILCISSIDWDFIWQGHQEIMTTLAEEGNRVLFVENLGVRTPGLRDLPRLKKRFLNWKKGLGGIRKKSEGLFIFSPLALPFPYSAIATRINSLILLRTLRRWMRSVQFDKPIIWTFLPTDLVLDLIDHIDHQCLIYYCIDHFASSSRAAEKIRRSEKRLCERADLIFVTSEQLKRRCETSNTSVHFFPFGVSLRTFEKAKQASARQPSELAALKRPLIGYVGGVHKWIDQNLLHHLAGKMPDCSFVLVGPVQTDVSLLEKRPNIHFVGGRTHEELPGYIQAFDVGLIPYVLTDYTRCVYPTKLNEYFFLGKPVVSTPLPEVIRFNRDFGELVSIGDGPDSFFRRVQETLKTANGTDVQRRIDAARQNSWTNRIESMSMLIADRIKEKRAFSESHWASAFQMAYRKTRRKLATILVVVGISWAAFFYTPFIWMLASPLKIAEAPQKADVIVVLGGGVGETRHPGISTIERARYASELYKAGWAPAILFSSGYVYSYQEAEDMKLIATSSGVPEDAILLETHSSSTYENVQFVKEILAQKKWDSILLVSAPYHMRRLSMVFHKVAPDIEVRYLPVAKSSFYGKKVPVQMGQLRALLHEVLGILYSWLKGFV